MLFLVIIFNTVFDGVIRESHGDPKILDGSKTLMTYFTLPGDNVQQDLEFPLASTLEREMGFVCHHAIHHNKVIKAMARAGETGLSVDDLPAEFGKAPTILVKEAAEEAA